MKVWLPTIRGNSGTDIFSRRLAGALQRRGIGVEVTWFPAHYQFAPFLLNRVSPPPGTDIIHANSWNGFAFKRAGIPLVVTEHLNVLDPLYRPYKTLAQQIYHTTLIQRFVMASFQAASGITAVSRFTAMSLGRILGIDTANVIHNWIDTQTFAPHKPGMNSRHRPFRLLFVGNFSRRKGADLLAPIMEGLGREFELRFTSGLKSRLKTGPGAQNMIPLGQLNGDSQLTQAYHYCDALLFASRFEGLPLAPLEAMACGKPVIAAHISSLPEIVEDGITGILCPRDNIGAFVAACRKLASDPEMATQYGQAARRRVEELFSEQFILPQYIALYRKLTTA